MSWSLPISCTTTSTPAAPAIKVTASSSPSEIVNQYCIGCHNSRLKTGGLALDAVDFTKVADNAAVLEKVVHKVGTGMMPCANDPEGMKTINGPGPHTHNRVGSFSGAMSASFQINPGDAPPVGDLETAKMYGKRVAEVAVKLAGK